MIWATSGPPESESLILKRRQDRLGGQPDHPAREHRHDRPPEALNGREGHDADQDHADDRQAAAVDLDRREPVGQEHRRADDRRPAELMPRGEFVGDPPQLGDRLDHVVLMRLLQPDDHGRGRAGRVDQRAQEQRMPRQPILERAPAPRASRRRRARPPPPSSRSFSGRRS